MVCSLHALRSKHTLPDSARKSCREDSDWSSLGQDWNPSLCPEGDSACVTGAHFGSVPSEPHNLKPGALSHAVRAPTIRPGTHYSYTPGFRVEATMSAWGLLLRRGTYSTHAQGKTEASGGQHPQSSPQPMVQRNWSENIPATSPIPPSGVLHCPPELPSWTVL